MEKNNLQELKKIFLFLSGSRTEAIKVKLSDLIYGLDHYGIEMDESKKQLLKKTLERRSEKGWIDFDDFKDCFNIKVEKKPNNKNEESKKLANEMFFLTHELLNIKDENSKLTKENIKNLFKIVYSLDNQTTTGGKNETQLSTKSGPDINDLKKLMNDENISKLIRSIDKDEDGNVSIVDFEYLVLAFINDKN